MNAGSAITSRDSRKCATWQRIATRVPGGRGEKTTPAIPRQERQRQRAARREEALRVRSAADRTLRRVRRIKREEQP